MTEVKARRGSIIRSVATLDLRKSILLATVLCLTLSARSQTQPAPAERLKFVLILSRHGVRSPTWSDARLNEYSAQPWPKWPVDPGLLTPHGKRLMTIFGAYDRLRFAEQGLLSKSGCQEAANIYVYADTDQRTRETGRGLVDGLMPGCSVEVHTPADDKAGSLFHPHSAVTPAEAQNALAELTGHLGGDPRALLAAYRLPLELMERTLSTCAVEPCNRDGRKKLFEVPAKLSFGEGDHIAELKGPLNTGATLAENFQLEYLEGMSGPQLGWGQLNQDTVEELMALHAASSDFVQRTHAIAAKQAGVLLEAILRTLQQSIEQKSVTGALGVPQDKVVLLVGHDTNLANVAALIDAHWFIDGYQRDDAAPGGALYFEVWQRDGTPDEVRLRYMVQTPAQMRQELPLSLAEPPASTPIYARGLETALTCTGDHCSPN